jgi:hypothetical protein
MVKVMEQSERRIMIDKEGQELIMLTCFMFASILSGKFEAETGEECSPAQMLKAGIEVATAMRDAMPEATSEEVAKQAAARFN